MFSEDAGRLIVYTRSQRMCEVCRRPASEWHHRVNRSQGGSWSPANGLDLCRWCHQWVTERRTHALALGLALPAGSNPAAHPAWLHPTMWWRGWWYADNDGCWTWDAARSLHPTPPEEVTAAYRALTIDRAISLTEV